MLGLATHFSEMLDFRDARFSRKEEDEEEEEEGSPCVKRQGRSYAQFRTYIASELCN